MVNITTTTNNNPPPTAVATDAVTPYRGGRALLVNFAPGVATVALIAALHPVVGRLHWPPVVGYTMAIALVTIGELAYLHRMAPPGTPWCRPRAATTLDRRLCLRAVAPTTAGFVVLTALVAGLLQPVADAISSITDRFVPDWLSPVTDHADVAQYGRTVLVVALVANLVIDAIINPYVEELYWKGHLMERLPVARTRQPVALAVLFAAEHFWQPADFVLVALVQLAVGIHAQRTRSLDVAIWTHWVVNGLVSVLTIVSVTG